MRHCRAIRVLVPILAGGLAGSFASGAEGDRFFGGAEDGYAQSERLQPGAAFVPGWYTGGGRDGYAQSERLQPGAAFVPGWYTGGGRDGYAQNERLQPGAALVPGWYTGGGRDGYQFCDYFKADSHTWSRWFSGGAKDGYGEQDRAGVANPLNRDTDGDGLPDWWELPNFGWITNASPNTDSDTDTVNNASEYIADTDPWDPDSYFQMTAILYDAGWMLSFNCSPARVYSLQVSVHVTGTWQQVEGATNQLGAADGIMSLADTNNGFRAFYRVGVSLPK